MYKKLPFKTEKGITLLCIVGSSNCYDAITNRRERHYAIIGEPNSTAEELMKVCEYWCEESSYGEFWRGVNGKWCNPSGLRRFFEEGIKNAVPLEDLLLFNRTEVMTCKLAGYYKGKFYETCVGRVSNGKEFDDWMEKSYETKRKLEDEGREVWYSLSFRNPESTSIVTPPVFKEYERYVIIQKHWNKWLFLTVGGGDCDSKGNVNKLFYFNSKGLAGAFTSDEIREIAKQEPWLLKGSKFIEYNNFRHKYGVD